MTKLGVIEVVGYYVYILASRQDGATYVGMTNDIVRRIFEHRTKAVRSFTSKYNITRLFRRGGGWKRSTVEIL
jgi:putative endonuclease